MASSILIVADHHGSAILSKVCESNARHYTHLWYWSGLSNDVEYEVICTREKRKLSWGEAIGHYGADALISDSGAVGVNAAAIDGMESETWP